MIASWCVKGRAQYTAPHDHLVRIWRSQINLSNISPFSMVFESAKGPSVVQTAYTEDNLHPGQYDSTHVRLPQTRWSVWYTFAYGSARLSNHSFERWPVSSAILCTSIHVSHLSSMEEHKWEPSMLLVSSFHGQSHMRIFFPTNTFLAREMIVFCYAQSWLVPGFGISLRRDPEQDREARSYIRTTDSAVSQVYDLALYISCQLSLFKLNFQHANGLDSFSLEEGQISPASWIVVRDVQPSALYLTSSSQHMLSSHLRQPQPILALYSSLLSVPAL